MLKNSIIAGNHGGTGPDDCVGQLSGDSKYNLIGDTNGCVIPSYVATYLLNVDPQLGPLGNNGGPAQTHLPAAGSPALEAGYAFPPPAADACEKRDQRGVPRPQGGGVCDMGAVEVTSANVFVTGFVLVNAAANTDIRPRLYGDTLVLSDLPSELSVRAVVTGSPGSVVFGYDDAPSFQTEMSLLMPWAEMRRAITIRSASLPAFIPSPQLRSPGWREEGPPAAVIRSLSGFGKLIKCLTP